VALVALGCPKNTVDAEVMLGDLQRYGLRVVEKPEEADIVIVNTCAFVEDAKRESIAAIMDAAHLKDDRSKPARGLFVTGCMAQRYADELAAELPEVDAVVGFESYAELPAQVLMLLERSGSTPVAQSILVGSASVPFRAEDERFQLTPGRGVSEGPHQRQHVARALVIARLGLPEAWPDGVHPIRDARGRPLAWRPTLPHV